MYGDTTKVTHAARNWEIEVGFEYGGRYFVKIDGVALQDMPGAPKSAALVPVLCKS